MSSMAKHRARAVCLLGKALFERAEHEGCEPEDLATTPAEHAAIKAYEDAQFVEHQRTVQLRSSRGARA